MNIFATFLALIAAIRLAIYFFITQSDTALGIAVLFLIALLIVFFIFAIDDDRRMIMGMLERRRKGRRRR